MVVDKICKASHINEHLNCLLQQYDDLETEVHTNGELILQSTKINSQVDQVKFETVSIDDKSQIKFAYPFKRVTISCSSCDGDLTIYSNPRKIPLALMCNNHIYNYSGTFQWYGMAYESLLRDNNINPSALTIFQKEIIDTIESYHDKPGSFTIRLGPKPDLAYLNVSVKKLLPFI